MRPADRSGPLLIFGSIAVITASQTLPVFEPAREFENTRFTERTASIPSTVDETDAVSAQGPCNGRATGSWLLDNDARCPG